MEMSGEFYDPFDLTAMKEAHRTEADLDVVAKIYLPRIELCSQALYWLSYLRSSYLGAYKWRKLVEDNI